MLAWALGPVRYMSLDGEEFRLQFGAVSLGLVRGMVRASGEAPPVLACLSAIDSVSIERRLPGTDRTLLPADDLKQTGKTVVSVKESNQALLLQTYTEQDHWVGLSLRSADPQEKLSMQIRGTDLSRCDLQSLSRDFRIPV